MRGKPAASGDEGVIGVAELSPNAAARGVEERRGRRLDVIRTLDGVPRRC